MKRTVAILFLTSILTGTLIFFSKINFARAEPMTWTVDDDGPADFQTIQEAINAANNGDNIFVKAGTYNEHIVVSKSVSLRGENQISTAIDGGGVGNVVEVTTDGAALKGLTIRNSGQVEIGDPPEFTTVKLDNVRLCSIAGNILMSYEFGIHLSSSSNNTISGNRIMGGLTSQSEGIVLQSSSNNSVVENNITNSGTGIEITDSSNNDIIDNNVVGDGGHSGLDFTSGSHNIISSNNIENNYYGVYVSGDFQENSVYHNNFVNNTNSTFSTWWDSSNNIWDDGYPSGGNHWSDYPTRYPNATEINGSGIWNTPYIVDSNNVDRYPLTGRFVISELPSIIVLPLFAMATLLTVIVYRKNDHQRLKRQSKENHHNYAL